MKASELKEMIRTIIAEELRVMLPIVMSEMFVRKIVAEQVNRQPVMRQEQVRRPNNESVSLSSKLGMEEYEEFQSPIIRNNSQVKQITREQVREKIRKSVLEDSSQNPMAGIYEGTNPIQDEGMVGDSGTDIPLEMLGLPSNLERLAGLSDNTTSRGQMQETDQMVQRRIERQRAKLDAIVVK